MLVNIVENLDCSHIVLKITSRNNGKLRDRSGNPIAQF